MDPNATAGNTQIPPQNPVEPACDLVMKGGITSGVVYPWAVARIAQSYRIDSVGGTSVGAIAAALTAAAEYWRRATLRDGDPDDAVATQRAWLREQIDASLAPYLASESDREPEERPPPSPSLDPQSEPGFAGLWGIPEDIGSDLIAKFEPQPRTRAVYQYVLPVLTANGVPRKLLKALLRGFYPMRVVGAFALGMLGLALLQETWAWVIFLLGFVGLGGFLLWWSWLGRDEQGGVVQIARATVPVRGVPWIAAAAIGLAALVVIVRAFGMPLVTSWQFWIAVPCLALFIWLNLRLQGAIAGMRRRLLGSVAIIAGAAGFVLIGYIAIGELEPTVTVEAGEVLVESAFGFNVPVGFGIREIRIDTVTVETFGAWISFVFGSLVGWVLGGILALGYALMRHLPRNYHGVCTGLGTSEEALTNWLTRKIDIVAGRDPDDPNTPPLSFSDLRNLDDGDRITLEVIASDLSRGVPLDLPAALRHYAFREDEFRDFFPARVVDHLVHTQPQPAGGDSGRLRFTSPDDVPLVIAARLSMSFPVLFSAVPLYYERDPSAEQRSWLSDGGIVSNFPVHKFDKTLAPHPTFAIDLISRETEPPDRLHRRVRISRISGRGVQGPAEASLGTMAAEESAAIAGGEIRDVLGLFGRMFDTSRGWMDNSQKTLPGYAERIVGIYLYRGEGGLNLTMPVERIRDLAGRGLYGVNRLLREWDPAVSTEQEEWRQHRWLRYRIAMRALEDVAKEWMREYERAPMYAVPGQPSVQIESIASLVRDVEVDSPLPGPNAGFYRYHWAEGESRVHAMEMTEEFEHFAEAALAHASGGHHGGTSLFDRPHAPAVKPRQIMLPPFE